MSIPPRHPVAESAAKSPPDQLPDEGILLGYSLEHEHRTAPIGFSYGPVRATPPSPSIAPTLDPILHTGGGHILTIAPTGAGKGISCIIPTLLRYPGPVIVIDPKGENYAVTADRRRALGQEVVVLDPVGITGAAEPGALNPLDLVDPSDGQCIDDTAALASLLSGGLEREDPKNLFWYQRGEQLLTGILQLVALTRRGSDRTLTEVRRILNLPADDFLQLAATEMANCPDPDVQQVAGTLVNPAQEMVGSILGMAQNSLGFLRGALLQASTTTSSFDLADVTAGKPLSIYIVIPPDKLESQRNLLRVWIGALMSALMRRRAPVPRSTLLVLDEAAQLGPLDQLRQAVTLMRGYGLQTWSFWQDMSQLVNLYPRDWETMYNNCRVHQAFGFATLKAATTTCELLGFHDPVEALQLDVDEMILSVSGDEAVIAQKPNYLTDPGFQGLYAPNPFYTKGVTDPPRPARPPRVYVRPAVETIEERERREASTGPASGAADDEPRPAPPSDAHVKARVHAFREMMDVLADSDAGGEEEPFRMPSGGLLDPLPGVRLENARAVPSVLERLIDRLGGSWNPITALIRGISPGFWEDRHIVEISDPTQEPDRRLAVIDGADVRAFAPRTDALMNLRGDIPTRLDDGTIAEWVRLRLHFDRHGGRRVRLVESLAQLRYWTGAADHQLAPLMEHVHDIRAVEEGSDGGGWTVEAVERVQDGLRPIRVTVAPDGAISSIEPAGPTIFVDTPVGYPTVDLDGEPLDPDLVADLLSYHGRWTPMGEMERRATLRSIARGDDDDVDEDAVLLRRELRCCPGYAMVRVLGGAPREQSFAFHGPDVGLRLTSLHRGFLLAFAQGLIGADAVTLVLDHPEAIMEYVRLHLWFMSNGTEKYAILLDGWDRIPLDPLAQLSPEVVDRLRDAWVPPSVLPRRDDDAEGIVARMSATTLHDARLSFVEFTVDEEGNVEIDTSKDDEERLPLDEEQLGRLLEMPPLGRGFPSRDRGLATADASGDREGEDGA